MNYDLNDCQWFSFITPLFTDACKHTKNKSWRRCRLYFRGRMQCWWIFDFETDYTIRFLNSRTVKVFASCRTAVVRLYSVSQNWHQTDE
jgi:hypothetical protein